MLKQKGLTLIELLVVIIIAMAVLMIMAQGFAGLSGNSNISIGINGMTESRCIEGYKFVVDQNGHSRQILDEFGKGVRCENPNAGKPGSFGKM